MALFQATPLPSGDIDDSDTSVGVSFQDVANVASVTGLIIALRAYYLYAQHARMGRVGVDDEALLTEM